MNLTWRELWLFIGLFGNLVFAQNFIGLQSSNYAGVYGIDVQPASVADNRLIFDLNLLGASAGIHNNYLGISTDVLLLRNRDINGGNYRELFPETLDGERKELFTNFDLHLPSLMVSLSPKHGFAITSRWRNFVNANGLEEPGARFAYESLNVPSQHGERFRNEDFSLDAASYLEFGLAYGREIINTGRHYVKAGGRVKYLSGLGAIFLYLDEIEYTFRDTVTLTVHDVDAQYAHSTAFETRNEDFDDFSLRDFFFDGNNGFGFDVGVVYEFRPKHNQYHVGRGKYRRPMRDKNKYRDKIGISVLDLGGIRFEQSPFSQDFTGSVDLYDLNQLKQDDIVEGDSVLNAEFEFIGSSNSFTMALPTAVNLQYDRRISGGLYVNAMLHAPINRRNNRQQVQFPAALSIAPRLEGKWLGLSVPVSWINYDRWAVGATLRLGPVIVGSNNILNLFLQDEVQGADVHVALRLPVPFGRIRDKDLDGVPDKKDKCPEVVGLVPLEGCSLDPIAMEATPLLSTPEPALAVATPVQTRSLDELPTFQDSVPTPVVAANPPIQNIETPPVVSLAPSIPPLPTPTFQKVFKEIPPFPSPSISEELPAIAANIPLAVAVPSPSWERFPPKRVKPEKPQVGSFGVNKALLKLPYADADGDGVPNREDRCPEIPGSPRFDGCPEYGEEAGYYSEDAFASIYFDVGKSDMRTLSRESLGLVARYLRENPGTMVRLSGHTDNTGTEVSNVDLSLNRCRSARKFLEIKGIPRNRIEIKYYGETRPAATNETTEGRQLNRRVDLIFFTP
ncbi:MAG: DUF5723 family protein [Bacteroidota bacterium]